MTCSPVEEIIRLYVRLTVADDYYGADDDGADDNNVDDDVDADDGSQWRR